MRKKLLSICLINLLSFSSLSFETGCTKKPVVVNAPAGVSATAVAQWYQATGAMLTLSETAKTAPQVIQTLYSSGAVDDEYKTGALNLIKDIDNGGLQAAQILQASPNNFNASTKTQVIALVNSMLTGLQNFNNQGGTHIKDPTKVANFNTLLATLQLALTTTQALSGGN